MINKLQKRFIVTAMTAISLLLFLLLAGLNGANAIMMSRQSDMLLNAISEPEPEPVPHMAIHPGGFDRVFDYSPTEDSKMGAVYFSVSFNAKAEPQKANVSHIASVSQADAIEMAASISIADGSEGSLEGFKYKVIKTPDQGYTATFLDTGSQRSSVLRTALVSLFAGLLCWLLMLLLVVLLSKRAILPIAENIEKQKRFVTDAGHELKTPLAIILANTEAMELHTGETKYSRNIRNQVARLSGLTKNLLTLAKADEHKLLGDLESIDFSVLVSETAAMFKENAELKHLSIDLKIEDKPLVVGSKEQLTQLLSIMLDNAVKYSPDDSAISLKLSACDKAVLEIRNSVSTTDIPTEYMFDRFYRADDSRNQKGGYGIGLSAAQAIVQGHGGTINAHYEDGNTICFTVKI